MPTPYSVHVFDEVTSTQDVARDTLRVRPVVVVASRQSRGRGRSQSEWVTAPRALAVTAAFDITSTFWEWQSQHLSLIPLVTGLAAASVLGERVSLKWPNDLLIGDRKLGGILVEVVGSTVAVGCGVNLWWPEAPSERVGLFDHDPGSQVGLATSLAESLWVRLAGGPKAWGAEEYLGRCATIGRRITWNGDQAGRARDIDRENGALVVETESGDLVRLNAGEVRHVR